MCISFNVIKSGYKGIYHFNVNKIFSFQVWLLFKAFVILQIRWAIGEKDIVVAPT